jgi:hypothetical protein
LIIWIKGKQRQSLENKTTPHMGLWTFLQIFNLGILACANGLETYLNSKEYLLNQRNPNQIKRKMKNLATCDNGQI